MQCRMCINKNKYLTMKFRIRKIIKKIYILFLLFYSVSVLSQTIAKDAKPLERELKVGYLLNYFFMSPKPYCWEKEEIYLSGWEVDKRNS